MIIPIRCFTCGKVISNRWEMYIKKKNEYLESSEEKKSYLDINNSKSIKTIEYKALEDCKIDRICCRRMFLTHTDLYNDI